MNKQSTNSFLAKTTSPVLFLRAASVISFVWAIGHTLGTYSMLNGSSKADLDSLIIIIEGTSNTISVLFHGYGWFITTYMIMQAILLWMLSSLSKREAVNIFIFVFLTGSITMAVLSEMFLIAIPMIFSIVIATLLFAALIAKTKYHE